MKETDEIKGIIFVKNAFRNSIIAIIITAFSGFTISSQVEGNIKYIILTCFALLIYMISYVYIKNQKKSKTLLLFLTESLSKNQKITAKRITLNFFELSTKEEKCSEKIFTKHLIDIISLKGLHQNIIDENTGLPVEINNMK